MYRQEYNFKVLILAAKVAASYEASTAASIEAATTTAFHSLMKPESTRPSLMNFIKAVVVGHRGGLHATRGVEASKDESFNISRQSGG